MNLNALNAKLDLSDVRLAQINPEADPARGGMLMIVTSAPLAARGYLWHMAPDGAHVLTPHEAPPSSYELLKARSGEAREGDVVLLAPTLPEWRASALLIVTEEKTFGAMGFVDVRHEDGEAGQAYLRVKREDYTVLAEAVWSPAGEVEA